METADNSRCQKPRRGFPEQKSTRGDLDFFIHGFSRRHWYPKGTLKFLGRNAVKSETLARARGSLAEDISFNISRPHCSRGRAAHCSWQCRWQVLLLSVVRFLGETYVHFLSVYPVDTRPCSVPRWTPTAGRRVPKCRKESTDRAKAGSSLFWLESLDWKLPRIFPRCVECVVRF